MFEYFRNEKGDKNLSCFHSKHALLLIEDFFHFLEEGI